MNKYITKRLTSIKRMSRVGLGLQWIIYYPLVNVIWLLYWGAIVAVIYGEKIYLKIYNDNQLFESMELIFNVANCVITIIFALVILAVIGDLIAKNDESNLMIVFGDSKSVELYQAILISKRRDKKNKIIKREFYTTIPMEQWQKNKDAICDRLDEHLIGDITYGGRRKDKGNHIYFESAKGRKPKERGVLYDDTF